MPRIPLKVIPLRGACGANPPRAEWDRGARGSVCAEEKHCIPDGPHVVKWARGSTGMRFQWDLVVSRWDLL